MKRVASTSRFAYREILPTLQPRERAVLAALRSHAGERREWPTAYELLGRMRAQHPGYDPNSIRPRLTSLRDKGLIVGERPHLEEPLIEADRLQRPPASLQDGRAHLKTLHAEQFGCPLGQQMLPRERPAAAAEEACFRHGDTGYHSARRA